MRGHERREQRVVPHLEACGYPTNSCSEAGPRKPGGRRQTNVWRLLNLFGIASRNFPRRSPRPFGAGRPAASVTRGATRPGGHGTAGDGRTGKPDGPIHLCSASSGQAGWPRQHYLPGSLANCPQFRKSRPDDVLVASPTLAASPLMNISPSSTLLRSAAGSRRPLYDCSTASFLATIQITNRSYSSELRIAVNLKSEFHGDTNRRFGRLSCLVHRIRFRYDPQTCYSFKIP